jgi:hypothetical protein
MDVLQTNYVIKLPENNDGAAGNDRFKKKNNNI